MKLELFMKVRDSAREDEEEVKLKRILGQIEAEEEEIVFTYKPYSIDLRDVGAFGLEDEEHTKIVMPFGIFFAKIDYEIFKIIYQTSLGIEVKTVSGFSIQR
jgi:hypothetical protein